MERRFTRATKLSWKRFKKNWPFYVVFSLIWWIAEQVILEKALEAGLREASRMKEPLLNFIVDLAEEPVAWFTVGAILIVTTLFVHSYFSAKLPPNAVAAVTLSKPKLGVSKPKRITLKHLIGIAEKQGWDMDGQHSMHILDLADAIRQAGLDGDLTIWRKVYREGLPELSKTAPLDIIPKTDWKNSVIDIASYMKAKSNFEIQTRRENTKDTKTPIYCDLHFPTNEVIEWLKNEAIDYRGRREGIYGKNQPSLKIKRTGYRFDEVNDSYVAFIAIENISSKIINGVCVKIGDVYKNNGEKIDIPIMPFRLFREPYRRIVGYSQTTSFPLPPHDIEEIAIADVRKKTGQIELCFARKEAASKGLPTTLGFYGAPYKLELFIHSVDGGEPVRVLYSLELKRDPEYSDIPTLVELER